MAHAHEASNDRKSVVVDKQFVQTQATQAMAQFFRPITLVFRQLRPNKWVVAKPSEPGVHEEAK
ncbi:MAG TPA: hypothetical protein VG939_14460 [Caulobacteraceae bacterium]|nr:hypothetical protein [Caulobacteraceae bacterium]